MEIQKYRQPIVAAAILSTALCASKWAHADVVTLKNGGAVEGKIVAPPAGSGSKAVAIRTKSGGLIVFEQQSVAKIMHGAASTSKPATKGKTASNKGPKRRLTPEQEAWLPKVRMLVDRARDGDANQARRARSDLLKIDDPDAVPALTRYLGGSSNEEARHLYVEILRGIPGVAPVYALVAVSLFDPSPQLREQARKSIGPTRADAARSLYIVALKLRNPNLASLAAMGIAEIGDPKGNAIPYLIDHLVYNTKELVSTTPGRFILDSPAFDPYWTPPGSPAAGGPVRIPIALNAPMSMGGSSSPAYEMGKGITFGRGDTAGTGYMNPWPQSGNTQGPAALTYVPPTSSVQKRTNVNMPVHDALVKLSNQSLGYNRDVWRRWWDNEKKNQDFQKERAPDRVVSKAQSAP